MSKGDRFRRQRITGYLFIAGGLLNLVVGYLIFDPEGPRITGYLGLLPATSILFYFGLKLILTKRDDGELYTNEMLKNSERAALNAFWVLIASILVGGTTQFLEEPYLSIAYVFIGMTVYVAFILYYKYAD